jgi:RNA polymerase sigma factor (sigma-70 family)
LSLTAQPLDGDEPIARDEEGRLVERAKRDREALGELYRQHYPTVYRFVHRRVGSRPDADDIVADVFLAMVRNLHQFRHHGVPFRAWLYRLAITQLSRWVRRRRRWAVQQLYDISKHNDSQNGDTPLDTEMVELVLLTLPPRLQTVFTLHYLEEMSLNEIADVVNCRLGTVKSRLSRARKMMRERLSKKGP